MARQLCEVKITLGSRRSIWLIKRMAHRTKAEFYIRGITSGSIEASEVIAWADEVIVAAPKTEEWMVDISSCGPEDRMKVLGYLNTVKGELNSAELNALLTARGIS